MSNIIEKKDEIKIQVYLSEHQSLKGEIKHFFSIQFTLIGVWLAFVSALVGYLFSIINNYREITNNFSLYTGEPVISNIFMLILLVLLPGVCNVLGLVWLDFSVRVIKTGHYIFLVENKIRKILSDDEYALGWEHFVYKDSQTKVKLGKFLNFYYYFFMLGIFFIVPITLCGYIAILVNFIHEDALVFYVILAFIEIFTFAFILIYLSRILYYNKQKEIESGVQKEKNFENIKVVLVNIFAIIAFIIVFLLLYWLTYTIIDFIISLLGLDLNMIIVLILSFIIDIVLGGFFLRDY